MWVDGISNLVTQVIVPQVIDTVQAASTAAFLNAALCVMEQGFVCSS